MAIRGVVIRGVVVRDAVVRGLVRLAVDPGFVVRT